MGRVPDRAPRDAGHQAMAPPTRSGAAAGPAMFGRARLVAG